MQEFPNVETVLFKISRIRFSVSKTKNCNGSLNFTLVGITNVTFIYQDNSKHTKSCSSSVIVTGTTFSKLRVTGACDSLHCFTN